MPRLPVALTAVLLAAALAASAAESPPADRELMRQIEAMRWSLNHSSSASRIDAGQRARSEDLLERARVEAMRGRIYVARDLVDQAAEPLAAMSPAAMAAPHPDPWRQFDELRSALDSITEGAALIVDSAETAGVLYAETAAAIRRSDALKRDGATNEALRVLHARYNAVQMIVAARRDGRLLVVELPRDRGAAQWSDGVRRIDDRKELTHVLILEAQAEGIDATALRSALATADESFRTASDHAAGQRWDQAFRWLDRSYALLEESWKSVGIEW